MADLERLCIHQVTFLEQWDFRQCVEGLAQHGITATAIWRDKLEAVGVDDAARILRDNGMNVTALCAGGFLTRPDDAGFEKSLDANRRLIDQAAALGAPGIVVITGGLEGEDRSLDQARERALDGFRRLIPDARAAGIRLLLEPLHPMVCGFRSVISTLKEANDWLDQFDADDVFSIAFDIYALWWEPDLKHEIRRAGPRIKAFHVSDWLVDTQDIRLDRGMPGDGVIDIPGVRSLLEQNGFGGYCEIEIFSERNWWQRDPHDVIPIIKDRFRTHV